MLILICCFLVGTIITASSAIVTISSIIFVISLFALLINCIGLINCRYIDEKITMYQEENQKIEDQINTAVGVYMDYESTVFENVETESSMVLVSLFPELKADALVASQIETYTDNNNKIKELREQKIDLRAKKWWIYFGG